MPFLLQTLIGWHSCATRRNRLSRLCWASTFGSFWKSRHDSLVASFLWISDTWFQLVRLLSWIIKTIENALIIIVKWIQIHQILGILHEFIISYVILLWMFHLWGIFLLNRFLTILNQSILIVKTPYLFRLSWYSAQTECMTRLLFRAQQVFEMFGIGHWLHGLSLLL